MARTIPFDGMPNPFFGSWEDMDPLERQAHIWAMEHPESQPPDAPVLTPEDMQGRAQQWAGIYGPGTPPFVGGGPPPAGPTPPQAQPQKPGGWRNTVKNIATGLGDAMIGAGTPNIAGGGATDVMRSVGGAIGARRQREQYEQQQQIAAERRKNEAEDRKRQVEYNTEKAKRDQKVAEQQMAADKARAEKDRLQGEREDRQHKYDHIKVVGDSMVNLETKEVTQIKKEKAEGWEKREEFMKKRFAATGDPADDPKTQGNRSWILYDYHGDPNQPKPDTNVTMFEALMNPATREAAEKLRNEQWAHEAHVAAMKKNADNSLTVADVSRMNDDYKDLRSLRENTKLEAMKTESRERARIMATLTEEQRGPELARAKQEREATNARADATYNAGLRETDARYSTNVGMSRKGGVPPVIPAAPPAAAPPPGKYPVIRGADGKAYYNMGLDANGNIKAMPVPEVR